MIGKLKTLGLTEYEARIYLALVKYGSMRAKAISEVSGVPKNRVYDSIMSLQRRGFVEVIPGKPITYKAVNPELVLKERIDALKMIKNELSDTYKKQVEYLGSEEKILMLRGYDNLVRFIMRESLLAKQELLFIIGSETVTGKRVTMIEREFKNAIKRGVKLRFIRNISDDLSLTKAVADTKIGILEKHYPYEGFSIHLIDRKSISIILPDKKFGVIMMCINNPSLAIAIRDYFERMWKEAIPLKEKMKQIPNL